MKYKKELIIIIISLVLLSTIGLFEKLRITGFTTASPELTINLTKTNYTTNEKLQGFIKIALNSPLDINSKIRVSMDNQITDYLLTDILNKSRITYALSEITEIATGQNTIKTLIFTEPSSQRIGLEIPANSTLTSISMNIEALAKDSSYPSFSSIDVASDGIIEWQYFGSLINYVNESVPPSLDLTREEIEYLGDNKTLYCDVMDLPYSKDFNFSVMYKKENSGGDIKLLALSCESCSGSAFTAYGGADTCDLPEETAKRWHSCILSFKDSSGSSLPTVGKYLICAYSTTMLNPSSTLYTLTTDRSQTNIAYTCNASTLSDGETRCAKKAWNNYYMKVGIGNYSKRLNNPIQFSSWLTTNSFEEAITDYLKTCRPSGYYCIVPLRVTSNTAGILKFSNLIANFKKPDNILSGTSEFADISTTAGTIYKINNIDLTRNATNITIQLSILNITVPNPSTNDIYSLVISLSSAMDNEYISVTSTSTPTEINLLQTQIENSKRRLQSTLADPETQEIMGFLNLKTALANIDSALSAYQTELSVINNSNLSADEKQIKINLISSNYNNLKKDIVEIDTKTEITQTSKIDISDMKDEILSEDQRTDERKNDILAFQDKFVITSVIKPFKLIKETGIEEKTIISKNIRALTAANDIYITEDIPKEIATNLNNIEFKNKDYEVINQDPIVRFYHKTLTTTEFSYLINKDLSLTNIQPKTIIVPKTEEAIQKWTCGDGKCTIPYEDRIICPEDCRGKVPYLWITIIVIALAIAVVLLNILKIKKKQIISKQDFEKLKTYVQDSLKKGLKKNEIVKTLLDRGWKQDQIDYVLKRVK